MNTEKTTITASARPENVRRIGQLPNLPIRNKLALAKLERELRALEEREHEAGFFDMPIST